MSGIRPQSKGSLSPHKSNVSQHAERDLGGLKARCLNQKTMHTAATEGLGENQAAEFASRTHDCGALRAVNTDEQVVLRGWVQSVRRLGGLIFGVVRDRHGLTQIQFNDADGKAFERALTITPESVVCVWGRVQKRPDTMRNPNMVTGDIEVSVSKVEIVNRARPAPMNMSSQSENKEETRLRHRHLDLRSSQMQSRLQMRSDAAWTVRSYLHENGFTEVETPTLFKSTPEGIQTLTP